MLPNNIMLFQGFLVNLSAAKRAKLGYVKLLNGEFLQKKIRKE